MQYENEIAASTPPSNYLVDVELAGIQGQRTLRLLRVSAGLLAALLAVTMIWLTPWMAVGMSPEDFNVATGVALALVAALGPFGGGLSSWIVSLAVTFVFYYLVVISRWEDEPKLT